MGIPSKYRTSNEEFGLTCCGLMWKTLQKSIFALKIPRKSRKKILLVPSSSSLKSAFWDQILTSQLILRSLSYFPPFLSAKITLYLKRPLSDLALNRSDNLFSK